MTHPNPTQQLDFKRFSSDALKDYLILERDLLHELTPGVPVTTNFMVMGETKAMDYADWAPEVDFVSNDHYTEPGPQSRDELSFSANLTGGRAINFDLGGSLAVARNLDLTVGVRYKAEQRDRLQLVDDGRRDSQAVYIGTAFKF